MNINSILNKVSEKIDLTQKTEKRSEIQEKGDFFKGSEIDEADIKRADLMGALQNLGGGYQPDPRNGHRPQRPAQRRKRALNHWKD